jgi:hypothetical protein
MSRLSTFFKGTDTEFGVFYPKNHLLAIFPNLTDAKRAAQELNNSGRGDQEVICVSGEEVVEFAEEHSLKDGLAAALMTQLSRMFGTEALYADKDLADAKKGAAFVAVHCPTREGKTAVWKIIEPMRPSVARYYSFGGIEHLAGEV